jgi:protease-4
VRSPASSDVASAAPALLPAEGWGPVAAIAARAGLPPYGPLLLPGSWKFD